MKAGLDSRKEDRKYVINWEYIKEQLTIWQYGDGERAGSFPDA